MKKLLLILLFAASPILAHADDATTTPDVSTSTPSVATITIRDGAVVAFTGTVELAASTAPQVEVTPTNASSPIAVAADSLLATLVALDTTTSDFDITDLGYFSSFDSFIINCISIPAASAEPRCSNWTYAVNGSFPQVGIDDTLLQDGDVVYLFFGPPRQTILSTTTVAVGEPFTATAQTYDLVSGTYVGASGLTLGVGTPNPDFSFTESTTAISDENGEAVFTMHATGTFAVGIQEDFYFPSASLMVTEVPATTTEAAEETPEPPPSSGGGNSGGTTHPRLDVPSALSFLGSKQQEDGSFTDDRLTDWAAVAFATQGSGAAKTKLRNYLLSSSPSLSSATDYERHAMALMAVEINPYSGTGANYIAPIVSTFDGTQFGYTTLATDDIFALFPLLHAGYSANDTIIQKAVAFILSAQTPSGGWDGSVDVTAASVQALSQVTSLPGVDAAIAKAENYLHSQQQHNGGFGEKGGSNSFSTSWALQGIAALGQSASDWAPDGDTPIDYLASLQESDGGVEPLSSDTQTRTWATEYAIVGALEKTWDSLLSSFPKPSTATGESGTVLGASTSTEATTIPAVVASSTPAVVFESTSTPPTTPQKLLPIANIPQLKKVTVTQPTTATPTRPSTVVSQTAAAASTSKGGFLSRLWHAIVSFFAYLF